MLTWALESGELSPRCCSLSSPSKSRSGGSRRGAMGSIELSKQITSSWRLAPRRHSTLFHSCQAVGPWSFTQKYFSYWVWQTKTARKPKHNLLSPVQRIRWDLKHMFERSRGRCYGRVQLKQTGFSSGKLGLRSKPHYCTSSTGRRRKSCWLQRTPSPPRWLDQRPSANRRSAPSCRFRRCHTATEATTAASSPQERAA
jgi:hypothetical protein